MSEDDSDDPVMALLATQRAVLAAVENLAAQVEAMQGQLGVMAEAIDRLTGAQASTTSKGARVSLGARCRLAKERQSGGKGQHVAGRVEHGARRYINKNNKTKH